jgi:hypothetical protein
LWSQPRNTRNIHGNGQAGRAVGLRTKRNTRTGSSPPRDFGRWADAEAAGWVWAGGKRVRGCPVRDPWLGRIQSSRIRVDCWAGRTDPRIGVHQRPFAVSGQGFDPRPASLPNGFRTPMAGASWHPDVRGGRAREFQRLCRSSGRPSGHCASQVAGSRPTAKAVHRLARGGAPVAQAARQAGAQATRSHLPSWWTSNHEENRRRRLYGVVP